MSEHFQSILSKWPRLSFAVFLTVISAGLLVFYFPVLSGAADFYISDLTYYFEPFACYFRQSLSEGRMPFWNSLMHCGMAQIAVPSPGVFYPLTWLMVLLPFSAGLGWYLFFHQLLAAAFGYLLARSLGWPRLAAWVVGLGCGLNGYMFALASNFTLIASAAWLPVALYFVERILQRRKRQALSLAGLAIAIALLIAAGRPEISALALPIVLVWIAARLLMNRELIASQGPLLFTGLSLGGLLAMPVILPALEWLLVSPRSKGMDLSYVLLWSANWYDWLSMYLLQPLGDLSKLGSPYRSLVETRSGYLPFLSSTCLGPCFILLACWGAMDKTWRFRFLVLGFLLSLVLLTSGSYTPIGPFVLGLSPALALFRYPVKMIIFSIFLLSLMAGRGVLVVCEQRTSAIMLKIGITISVLSILTGLLFLFVPQLTELLPYAPWLKGKFYSMQVMRQAQHLFGLSALSAGLLNGIMVLALRWYRDNKVTTAGFSALLVSLCFLPTMYCALSNGQHYTKFGFFERPSQTQKLLDLEGFEGEESGFQYRYLSLCFDPLNCPPWYPKEENLPFHEAFYEYARELLLSNTNLEVDFPHSYGYESAEVGRFKNLFLNGFAPCSQNLRIKRKPGEAVNDYPIARFCQVTAAKYLITQVYRYHNKKSDLPLLPKELFELVEEDRHTNVRIYKFLRARPRFYLAEGLEAVDDWNALSDRLKQAQLSDSKTPANWLIPEGQIYVLKSYGLAAMNADLKQSPTGVMVSKGSSGLKLNKSRREQAIGFVSVKRDDSESIALSVSAKKDTLLVVADQYYPGWRAQVDGADADILAVNIVNRAIKIPAGKHEVSMRYQPDSLAYGLLASLIAGLILGALVVFSPILVLNKFFCFGRLYDSVLPS